jgi:hypothetical protein
LLPVRVLAQRVLWRLGLVQRLALVRVLQQALPARRLAQAAGAHRPGR